MQYIIYSLLTKCLRRLLFGTPVLLKTIASQNFPSDMNYVL